MESIASAMEPSDPSALESAAFTMLSAASILDSTLSAMESPPPRMGSIRSPTSLRGQKSPNNWTRAIQLDEKIQAERKPSEIQAERKPSEIQAERKPSEIHQAKRKSTRSEEELRSDEKLSVNVCEACMRSGHPDILCPYRKSVKEGTPVGRGWKIICHRCRAENCRPGDKYVHRIVGRKYCSTCAGTGNHDGIHCPYLTPEEKEGMCNFIKLKQRVCDRLARERMDRKLAREMEKPLTPKCEDEKGKVCHGTPESSKVDVDCDGGSCTSISGRRQTIEVAKLEMMRIC